MTVVHTIITIVAALAVIKWIKWKVIARTITYILVEKRCTEPSDEELRECTKIVIRKSIEDLMKSNR